MSGRPFRMVGLTGGIASGKSVVAGMLRQLGAQVIDADQIARELVEPGSLALSEIAARFPGVVSADGALDRAMLGERIFADPGERAALNAILHPRIQKVVADRATALADAGNLTAIYEVPLLFENGLQKNLSGVILVSAPEQVQISRMMTRNGYSSDQAMARLAAQMPLSEKRKWATWVIDNSGDLASLRTQVEAVWRQIQP